MNPIIGITANYSRDDIHGTISKIGLQGQEWQLIADDYVKTIERAGGQPVIIPIIENLETMTRTINLLDGIIFSGGADIHPRVYGESPKKNLGIMNPNRDIHEINLAKKVLYEMNIPVLGVCRGIQLLNVATGGTLYQDLILEKKEVFNHSLLGSPKDYPAHKVNIKKESRLYEIFKKEELWVNSYHHQGIKKLGKDFIVTMTADDGVIEAIEYSSDRFVVAVQWHPEMMFEKNDEYMDLFNKFIEECKKGIA